MDIFFATNVLPLSVSHYQNVRRIDKALKKWLYDKIDEKGASARWVIASCNFLYADLDLISDDRLGATMIVLNGANIYNAFHEIAQFQRLISCKIMAIFVFWKYHVKN